MPSRSPIRFVLADASHDAGLRQLLRTAPMAGRIGVSLEREPSFFAAADLDAPEHYTIVALDLVDEIACAGTISIRQRYLNGQPARVGYLGQLRLAQCHAGRIDILRDGYQFFRALHDQLRVAAYFTTIASDNTRALRLLERGLRTFPEYRPLAELVTVLVPVRRASAPVRSRLRKSGKSFRHGFGESPDALVALLAEHNARYQFAPAWSTEELTGAVALFNLRENAFRVVSSGGRFIAAAAMWDQRSFKQAVITRYPPLLSAVRPLYNAVASLAGFGRLPAPGQPIPQGFISHLASTPETLVPLLDLLTASARTAGIRYFTLTLDARDPRLGVLTGRFRPRLYHTRLYAVSWPDVPPACPPDDRLMYPEAALL